MEYEQSRVIDAPDGEVWDLVSDVTRLPEWLVDTETAQMPSPDVVELVRDTDAGPYQVEGLFRAQADQRRVEWGSRDTGDYAGWLQIYDSGESRCEVNVHLSFLAEQPEAGAGPAQEGVEEELSRTLDRLAARFAR